ncbi:hypothetical protein Sme01_59400 [Sphaerisporangium melleum]|uniref:Peptidase C14 caspase domain-containing protein n=1 Tax=Sphaerisporangium melleum TaxID=321316 RepID=A0A917VLH6_9ACTN|nr:caspase family protein [Sphaerisporangium melleum]GGK92933.1 hypothetical protein GCM10007964_39330 [Sphaerisporangium melleum]GII73464.1 hypothetical protein Sme01_59400 [Sphaerisporangium melleum]
MERRLALVIACYAYEDPGLRRLTAPAHDADALSSVLSDPLIAGFEVTTLVNEPHHRVGEAIAELYRDRSRNDVTLLYFTGHGLKDDAGRLFLAMANTRRDSLLFTALSAEQIDQAMEGCASRRKILILDCRYSGAFPSGRLAKGDSAVHSLERFRGRGRVVLTASDATQYSFEGDRLRGEAVRSVFTHHLVEGLREGHADLDRDGNITVDELYDYVYERVVAETPQQRPKKQDDVEGRIVVARNVRWTLPAHLRAALASPIPAVRLGALEGLTDLHGKGNEFVRAAVLGEIERLADDDSRQVSAAAARWLTAGSEPAANAGSGFSGRQHRDVRDPRPDEEDDDPGGRRESVKRQSERPEERGKSVATSGEVAGEGGPSARSGRRRPRAVRWFLDAGLPAALLALAAAGLLVAGQIQWNGSRAAAVASARSGASYFAVGPGPGAALGWYTAILAFAALLGAALTVLPRTRSLVGPGFLAGIGAAAAWGLAYFAGDFRPGLDFGGRFPGEIAGHVLLLGAALCALYTLWRHPAARLRPVPPHAWARRAVLVLAILGAFALLGALADVAAVKRVEEEVRVWAAPFQVAAMLALVLPAAAVTSATRSLGLSLLAGWIAGGTAILATMVALAMDGASPAPTMVAPVAVFAGTLALLCLAAVVWARVPEAASASPVHGRRRLGVAALPVLLALNAATGLGVVVRYDEFPALVTSVAVSPDGTRVYAVGDIKGSGGTRMWRIDTATRRTVGRSVALGSGFQSFYQIAISSDGHRAYISRHDTNSVRVVDTRTNAIVGQPITVGSRPAGIAVSPDGRYVYVANTDSATVSVIYTRTGTAARPPIPVGVRPRGLAVGPKGRIYVADSGSRQVSVIDPVTGQRTEVPTRDDARGEPGGLAVSPDGTRLYVSTGGIWNLTGEGLQEVDIKAEPPTGKWYDVSIGASGRRARVEGWSGVAVSGDGEEVYVTNGWSDALLTFLPAAGRVSTRPIRVGRHATGIAVAPDGRYLYVATFDGVSIVDIVAGTSELVSLYA